MMWRKSSHSETLSCVEAASWRRSRACDGGACIEAGHGPGVVGIRDSQLGEESPVLEVSPGAWEWFISSFRYAY